MVTTAFLTNYAVANAVALQGDGKIVAAGDTSPAFNQGLFALARYNPDGTLDGTFGTGGKVTTAVGMFNTGANARAVAVQGDGKIVAAGEAGVADAFALARYNPDGSLDATFGTHGTVTTLFGMDIGDLNAALAVAVQEDGKIVAAGYTDAGTQTQDYFALARYNPDGSLDATFGTGGLVTTAFGTTSDFANAVALQADGKIVAAGGTDITLETKTAFAIARYCGSANTCAPTTTTTSNTTPTPPTTTTTTLPCTTARCTLGAVLVSPACAGQTIPASVTGKLITAENLIEQAATTPGKKARKVRQKARNLLRQAGAKATHAAKGKKAKLLAGCAAAIKDTAGHVAAGL